MGMSIYEVSSLGPTSKENLEKYYPGGRTVIALRCNLCRLTQVLPL